MLTFTTCKVFWFDSSFIFVVLCPEDAKESTIFLERTPGALI